MMTLVASSTMPGLYRQQELVLALAGTQELPKQMASLWVVVMRLELCHRLALVPGQAALQTLLLSQRVVASAARCYWRCPLQDDAPLRLNTMARQLSPAPPPPAWL